MAEDPFSKLQRVLTSFGDALGDALRQIAPITEGPKVGEKLTVTVRHRRGRPPKM